VVVAALDHAIDVLKGINQSFAEAVTHEDMRAKLEALRVGLKSASATAGDIIARSAGLSFGFNAMAETSVMDVDRRTLLISLASTAATLALPKHALDALASSPIGTFRAGAISACLTSMTAAGSRPTHHQANFLLTSGEGWLATADSNGAMERQASSFQWDNHAILVR